MQHRFSVFSTAFNYSVVVSRLKYARASTVLTSNHLQGGPLDSNKTCSLQRIFLLEMPTQWQCNHAWHLSHLTIIDSESDMESVTVRQGWSLQNLHTDWYFTDSLTNVVLTFADWLSKSSHTTPGSMDYSILYSGKLWRGF